VNLAPKKESSTPPGASLSGKWTMIAAAGGENIEVNFDLKQTGSDFTGSLISHLGPGTIEGGKISGNTVTGLIKTEMNGQPLEITMNGKWEGDKISGTLSGAGIPEIPFTATRTVAN
jgi:hypothetical protein